MKPIETKAIMGLFEIILTPNPRSLDGSDGICSGNLLVRRKP